MEVAKGSSRFLNEIDLIKVVAIVGMIFVHVYDNILSHIDLGSPLSVVIKFFGGPLAAPVFIFAMGVGMVYTKHDTPMDFFKRGMALFLIAYVLSVIRIIPYITIASMEPDVIIACLLQVDILQFAGIAFMFVGLLKCFPINRWHLLIISVVMYIIAALVGTVDVHNNFNYFVGLFIFTPAQFVSFPLFNWFQFVAIGVLIGAYLKEHSDRGDVYRWVLPIGFVMMVCCWIYALIAHISFTDCFVKDDQYYPMFYVFYISGIVLTYVSLVYYILRSFDTTKLDNVTRYLSRNLTRIYIIQWIIITIVEASVMAADITFDSVAMTIPIALAILALTLLITPLYEHTSKSIRARMAESHERW